jgi:hypothetical protein
MQLNISLYSLTCDPKDLIIEKNQYIFQVKQFIYFGQPLQILFIHLELENRLKTINLKP